MAPDSTERLMVVIVLLATIGILRIVVGWGLLKAQKWAWWTAQLWIALHFVGATGLLIWGFVKARETGVVPVNEESEIVLGGMAVLSGVILLLWRKASVRAFFGAPVRSLAVASVQGLQRRLEQIEQLVGRQKAKRALTLCQEVIRDLTAAGELTQEQRQYLGRALLIQGQLLEQQGQRDKAAESYLAARPITTLPAEALSYLALYLAAQQETTDQAIEIYLDCLSTARAVLSTDNTWIDSRHRGQPHSADMDPVYLLLHDLCRVDEEVPSDRDDAVLALNRRVLEADAGVGWAHYYLGLALARQGDYAQAVSHMEKAESLNRARRETTYFIELYQGILHERSGEHSVALRLFRKAIDVIEDRPEAHFFLAKALVAECEELEERDEPNAAASLHRLAEEAVQRIARAVALRPHVADYHFYRGLACSYAGDIQTAVEAYQQALAVRPEASEYHRHLAIAWGRLSRLTDALQEVERAVALDPREAQSYAVWGDLLSAEGQHEQAVNQYRRAFDLDSRHVRARLGLGRAWYHLRQFGDAARELEAVQTRYREAAYLLARCYSLTDQFAQAVSLLTSLTARPDASVDLFYYLGCAYANLGQIPRAIDALSSCLRLDPSYWRAHLQRGHCYLTTQEWGSAQTDYQQALELQPHEPEVALALIRYHLLRGEDEEVGLGLERLAETPSTSWEVHIIMGALAEKGADLARAEKAYLAAVNAKPDRPEPRVRLGLLYCRQKRYQDAYQHLQRAAEAGQRTDSVLFYWGQALAETGDYAGALSVWRELYQRHPEDESLALNLSQLQYLVGRQHAEAERYEEAIVAWEAFLTSCPDDETLKRDIAELYFRLGLRDFATGSNHNRPRQALNSALALNGDHPFVPFYLALCDLVDGQSERAAERFSGFSADHPLYLRAIYHQGLAYLQMGQNTRALELLQATANHPHRNNLNLPVELALAMTYVRSEQWEEALAVLKVQRP